MCDTGQFQPLVLSPQSLSFGRSALRRAFRYIFARLVFPRLKTARYPLSVVRCLLSQKSLAKDAAAIPNALGLLKTNFPFSTLNFQFHKLPHAIYVSPFQASSRLRNFTSYNSVSLRLCVSATLQLCVSASLQLCVSATLHLCVSASLRLCVFASLKKERHIDCSAPYFSGQRLLSVVRSLLSLIQKQQIYLF